MKELFSAILVIGRVLIQTHTKNTIRNKSDTYTKYFLPTKSNTFLKILTSLAQINMLTILYTHADSIYVNLEWNIFIIEA